MLKAELREVKEINGRHKERESGKHYILKGKLNWGCRKGVEGYWSDEERWKGDGKRTKKRNVSTEAQMIALTLRNL